MFNIKNIKSEIKIAVIGGDLRQVAAAEELARAGYEAAVYGFDEYEGSFTEATRCVNLKDAIRGADFIALPLPYSLDGLHLNMPLSQCDIHLEELFSLANDGQIILGGKFDDKTPIQTQNLKEVKFIDYYKREDLSVLNALPTAEGAINIAMQETAETLSGAKILIMGYGRIGKILAHKLYGLHAKIYISARSHEDLAWIEAFGYSGLNYNNLDESLDKFDVIFNTVPALLLDENRLDKINKDCVIIDLASSPGGIDFNAAKNLGRNVIWALSLPGKYAPITSGKILAKTIKSIIEEEIVNKQKNLIEENMNKKKEADLL